MNSQQYQNLEYLAGWFVPSAKYDVDYAKSLQLKEFIATPILVFNYQFLQTPGIAPVLPIGNLNKTRLFVKPRYQVSDLGGIKLTRKVLISAASFYSFVAASALSILWCFIVLLACVFIAQLPTITLFPEISFASRSILPTCRHSRDIAALLYPLTNASNRGIKRRLAGISFFLGRRGLALEEGEAGPNAGHVQIDLVMEDKLIKGKHY